MPVVNQIITLDQAIAREFPTWDVIVKPFGQTVGTLNDFVYPTLEQDNRNSDRKALGAVSAIAIGPRSSIDRCWVIWDPQARVEALEPPAKIAIPDFFRRLSVEAPLLFQQIGNKKLPGGSGTPFQCIDPISALRFGAAPISFRGGLGSITNLDDDGGVFVPTTFIQTAVGSSVTAELNPATTQQLHLVFYLQPPLSGVPTKRYPYKKTNTFILGTSSPQTMAYGVSFPVFGRKHIRLVFDSLAGVSYTATVGGMICQNQTSSPPSDVQLATIATVSTTQTRTVTFDNPMVDYINIYGTAAAGGGTGRVTCFAYD